jgi:hypothetical protein
MESLFYESCETNNVAYVMAHEFPRAIQMRGARIAYYHNNRQIWHYLNDLIGISEEYYENSIDVFEYDENKNYYTQDRKNDYTMILIEDEFYFIGPLLWEFQGPESILCFRHLASFNILYTKTHDQELDQYVYRDEIGVIFIGDIEDEIGMVISEDFSDIVIQEIGRMWEQGDGQAIDNIEPTSSLVNWVEPNERHDSLLAILNQHAQ